jgi:hypothetical protein
MWNSPIGLRQGGYPPQLRAYDPTWRDRMASFFLGDQPSYHAGEIARGVLGSSGIGTTGPSAIDFVPGAGPALNAQEAVQHGDIPEAAGQIAAAAVPGGALASKALMPVARPLVRAATAGGTGLAAGTAAAFGLQPQEAEAQPKSIVNLTPAETALYRQLGPNDKIQFLAKKTEVERAEAAKNAAAERDLRGQADRAEIERQFQVKQAADQNEARIAEEKRVAGLPFRERYPLAAALVQAGGMAGASAVPFFAAKAGVSGANQAVREWKTVADRATKAIEGGDIDKARVAANELAVRNAGYPPPSPGGWANTAKAIGKGAALVNAPVMPFEGGTVLPNMWDYYAHPEGEPAHEHAVREFTERLPQNLGVGFAEGIPLMATGAKVGSMTFPRAASPIERSRSLVTSYEQAFPPHLRDPSLPPLASLPPMPAPPTPIRGPLTSMNGSTPMPPRMPAATATSPRTMQDVLDEMEQLRSLPAGQLTTPGGKGMLTLVEELRRLRGAGNGP